MNTEPKRKKDAMTDLVDEVSSVSDSETPSKEGEVVDATGAVVTLDVEKDRLLTKAAKELLKYYRKVDGKWKKIK